jgi:hypothetical protein
MSENPDASSMVTPGLIHRPQMGALLLEACPSFEPEYKKFVAEWADEPDLPMYCVFGDFARHLSGLLVQRNNQVLHRVFSVVERFIVQGDKYVQEAAIVGILEDLQNGNLHSGTTPEQYLPFLLPQSRRWWGKVEAFWKEGRLLNDD